MARANPEQMDSFATTNWRNEKRKSRANGLVCDDEFAKKKRKSRANGLICDDEFAVKTNR